MNLDFNRYYMWDHDPNSKYKIDNMLTEVPSKAVIFAPEEFELQWGWREGVVPESIDLTVVLGSANSDYLLEYENRSVPETAKICLWPSYWINATYSNLKDKQLPLTTIDRLFISMNSNAHPHRCAMMDELCRNDLINYGHLSWHNPHIVYDWKYWKPEKLVLDPGYNTQLYQYTIPSEYSSTVFNLITETSTRAPFITEKTCIAILFKKPFIVFGASGFHKELTNLGFELYDELFDYSFDDSKDVTHRLDGIIQNINRLKHQNYEMLRKSVEAKAERNHKHMIEIATSKQYVPELIISYLELLKQRPDIVRHPRDHIYLNIEQLLIR